MPILAKILNDSEINYRSLNDCGKFHLSLDLPMALFRIFHALFTLNVFDSRLSLK